MKARFRHCEEVCKVGEELINNNHYAKRDIKTRINSMREKWQRLLELSKQRRIRLEDAYESHQVTPETSMVYQCEQGSHSDWKPRKMGRRFPVRENSGNLR